MAVAYSQDLRERVLAAREAGMKTKRVADTFRVSASWVRRVIQRRRDHGEHAPRPRGGATVIKIDMALLRRLCEQQPDATARELHQRLGARCSVAAVDIALRRMGLSFKKRRCMPPSRIEPMSPNGASNGSRSSPLATPAG